MIDLIYESSAQVKGAIRMANNEVDKIRDLKMRKDDEEKKVENRKEEKVRMEARELEL